MKIGLKTTVAQLPKKALGGINEVGASTRGMVKGAGEFVKQSADKFIQTRPMQGLKKAGFSKDTLIGIALIGLATTKAIQVGNSIKNRVDESRQTLKQ